MILKHLTMSQLQTIYQEQLYYDFPDNERRSFQNMCDYHQRGLYEAWGLFDNDQCIAYSCFMGGKKHKILDYFAVNRAYRNQGIGSIFLKDCLAQYPNALILIESEKEDGIDPWKTKRMQFYLRNGLYNTKTTIQLYYVNYVILANHPTNQKEISIVYQELYDAAFLKKYFHIIN